MKCKAKVKINTSVVKKIQDAAFIAMELTAEAVLSDIVSRQVVPKDNNDLEDSGFVEEIKQGVYAIVFDTPYARRWYFNLPVTDKNGKHYRPATFQKTKNANAQAHWMDYYLDGEGKEWLIQTFIKLWKEKAGGLIK